MKPPLASVIIGVHNRADQMLTCLDSLLAMECRDVEIIVVDDASTNDTLERLARFQQQHPAAALRLVPSRQHLGAAGARNVGMEVAQGEFFCFTDSDCTVDRMWLTALLAEFSSERTAAVSGAVRDEPVRTLAERAHAGSGNLERKAPNLHEANMAIRAELGRSYGFDSAIVYGAEGDDLARRLQTQGHEIGFVPDAVVYHNHPMNSWQYLIRGYRLAQGSARYWYKHGIYLGLDLWPLTLAILTCPLALIDIRLALIPALLLGLQLAASVYNELFLKGKSLAETCIVLPVEMLYYGFRACGAYRTLARIACGLEQPIRQAKRQWRSQLQTGKRRTSCK